MATLTSDGGLSIRVRVDASRALNGMANLRKRLDTAMVTLQNETRAEAIRELEYATSTWDHQPAFKGTVWHRGDHLSVKVSTADKIFIYVDQGTRPHVIRPKGPGYPLAFQKGYKAKSQVGVLRGYRGGKFGGMVYAMVVHHPGTKARGFMNKVQDKVGRWALKRARALMREAAARH